jgi:hypothetical protein
VALTEDQSLVYRGLAIGILSTLLLVACSLATVYPDHQPVRARVIQVWTTQRMIEDWRVNLQQLDGAPPLQRYVDDFRRVDVYAGRTMRAARFENAVARAGLRLSKGDIIEMDTGLKSQSPIRFEDLGLVTRFACGDADRRCADDPTKRVSLGRLAN